MKFSDEKGRNWLLPVPSAPSIRWILSALRCNKQKGFVNCCLITAEKSDKEKIVILHLKKSIRKRQVDKLLKLKSEKKMGYIDEIKGELKSQGYYALRTIQISGSARQKQLLSVTKHNSLQKTKQPSKTNTLEATKDMETTSKPKNSGAYSEQAVTEYTTQRVKCELLDCLEQDAGLDVSGCIDLPQTVRMVCDTIKKLMLDSKILFTNIEDLEDDRNQDRTRIMNLVEQCEVFNKLYTAKLEVHKKLYEELFDQHQNLKSRFSRMERRETETMERAYQRFEEWKTQVDPAAAGARGGCQ